jgi:hypothetical protein
MKTGLDASVVLQLIVAMPADLVKARPGFVGRMIHAEYRSAGCEVLTFERAARKLPGSRVLAAS